MKIKLTFSQIFLIALTAPTATSVAEATATDENFQLRGQPSFAYEASARRQLSLFDIQLFGKTTVCRNKFFGDDVYVTKSVWRLFLAFYTSRGGSTGSCETECSGICDHQPCFDDFTLSNGNERCECASAPMDTCGSNTQCLAGDVCSCLDGYEGDAGNPSEGCINIDECLSDNTNNCGDNTICTDTEGSFTCTCANGYAGEPTEGCEDINECDTADICGPNGTCSNRDGGYSCICDDGYFWNNPPLGICEDVEDCATVSCGDNAVCADVPGSFVCSCAPGYESAGTPPSDPCTDINECTADPTFCGDNASCFNDVGSFSCSCNPGFDGDPPTSSCTPNSCTAIGLTCGTDAVCSDAGATPECVCPNGTEGDPSVSCTDIDECSQINDCLNTQTCVNLQGSFSCLLNAWEECPTGDSSTCNTIAGLSCNRESGSNTTLTCCVSFRECDGTTCCNDAYLEGEECVFEADCAGTLDCGRTLLDDTFRCCESTRNSILGFKICELL